MALFIPVDEFDLVIFGGTGDLALRKLMPALYHRVGDEQITGGSRIIAASRGALARDEYVQSVEDALRKNLPDGEFRDEQWAEFRDRIHYVQVDAKDPGNWQGLKDILADNEDRVATSLLETPTPGFAVWNLRGYWQASDRYLLIAGVENYGDRHYREYLDFRSRAPGALDVFQPGSNFYFGSELTY